MFSQYFGNYLLNKGLVSTDQLREAISFQDSVHVKLGVLAMNAGYMTAAQVEKVHSLQKKVDKKLGEIAIESGYLTDSQLEDLLSTQKQGHLVLSQALVDKGYFNLEQLQSSLEGYKKEFNLSDDRFKAIQQGDIEEIVRTFVDFGDNPQSDIFAGFFSLMIRNLVRFIDSSPRVDKSYRAAEYTQAWIASQEVYGGNFNIYTALCCDEKSFLFMAGKYAEEAFTQVDELAKASVGEFLNLNNGIFLVNMSNRGTELEMKPQVVEAGSERGPLKNVTVIPVFLGEGKIDIVLSC